MLNISKIMPATARPKKHRDMGSDTLGNDTCDRQCEAQSPIVSVNLNFSISFLITVSPCLASQR